MKFISKSKIMFVSFMIGGVLLSFGSSKVVLAASHDMKIIVDGKGLTTDVAPKVIANRTLLPLRAVFESLGAQVEWNSNTQEVRGTKGSTVIVLHFNDTHAQVNGKDVVLDVAPVVIDNRTLVPVRFIAESLGANVNWDSKTNTINIESQKTYALAVQTDGQGEVKTDDQQSYNSGVSASLNAIPAQGWKFDHWEGDGIADPKSATTSILMDENKTAKAVFVKQELILKPIPGVVGEDQLKQYLQDNYSRVVTPAGTWYFSFSVEENDDSFFPNDYDLSVDWISGQGLDPFTLKYSTKISDTDRLQTEQILTEMQKEIANVAIQALPAKKIKGRFYSGSYKYPYLKVGYSSTKFLTWNNYDNVTDEMFEDYQNTKVSDFHWDVEGDDYQFLQEPTDPNFSVLDLVKQTQTDAQNTPWTKAPKDTYGADWLQMPATQKDTVMTKLFAIWAVEGRVVVKDKSWFIQQADEFYKDPSKRILDVQSILEIVAIGEGGFDLVQEEANKMSQQ